MTFRIPNTRKSYPFDVGINSCYPTPYFGPLETEIDDKEEVMRLDPKVKDTVAFLYIQKGDEFFPIGTAFFVIEVEADIGFHYLVTCKHVIEEPLETGLTIYARFNRVDKLDVNYLTLPNNWVYHDDSVIDLAVLPWIPPKQSQPTIIWGALEFKNNYLSEDILKKAGGSLIEGDDALFVGLFAQYTGVNRNYPVVRQGRIALVTNEPVMGIYGLSDYLFLECQAYPGNSGSPMFIAYRNVITQKPQLFLAGIIQSFYPEQQAIYIDQKTLQVYTHFGISLATPIQKLADILYGDELMKKRKKRIGASQIKKAPTPASSLDTEQGVMTRDEFLKILKRVSVPSQPDQEKKETSE